MTTCSRVNRARDHRAYMHAPGTSQSQYASIPPPIVINYNEKNPAPPVVSPWWQKSHATLRHKAIQPNKDAFAAKRRARSHSDQEEVKDRVERSIKRRRYKSSKLPGLDFDIPKDFSDGSNKSQKPSPSSRSSSPSFEPESTIFTLPRFLARPKFKKFQLKHLTRINPELEGIPIEYVQDDIEAHGDKLLAVIRGIRCPPPKGQHLPNETRVVCDNLETAPPTHVLAVHSRLSGRDDKGRRRVRFFPTHDLVLHAHCSNLPQLPLASDNPNLEEGWWHTVPLIPLCIPSPDLWPVMSHYLYTRDPDHFFQTVFPLPWPDPFEHPMGTVDEDGNDIHVTYAWKLSQEFTASKLVELSEKILALLSNTKALGIQDEKWWSIMDYAWEVYLSAISYSTKTPERMGLEPRSH